MSATTQRSLTNFQPSLGSLAGSVVRTINLWRSRIRERRAFPVLDDRELRDLRLSRWQVEQELSKPFWRG